MAPFLGAANFVTHDDESAELTFQLDDGNGSPLAIVAGSASLLQVVYSSGGTATYTFPLPSSVVQVDPHTVRVTWDAGSVSTPADGGVGVIYVPSNDPTVANVTIAPGLTTCNAV